MCQKVQSAWKNDFFNDVKPNEDLLRAADESARHKQDKNEESDAVKHIDKQIRIKNSTTRMAAWRQKTLINLIKRPWKGDHRWGTMDAHGLGTAWTGDLRIMGSWIGHGNRSPGRLRYNRLRSHLHILAWGFTYLGDYSVGDFFTQLTVIQRY